MVLYLACHVIPDSYDIRERAKVSIPVCPRRSQFRDIRILKIGSVSISLMRPRQSPMDWDFTTNENMFFTRLGHALELSYVAPPMITKCSIRYSLIFGICRCELDKGKIFLIARTFLHKLHSFSCTEIFPFTIKINVPCH